MKEKIAYYECFIVLKIWDHYHLLYSLYPLIFFHRIFFNLPFFLWDIFFLFWPWLGLCFSSRYAPPNIWVSHALWIFHNISLIFDFSISYCLLVWGVILVRFFLWNAQLGSNRNHKEDILEHDRMTKMVFHNSKCKRLGPINFILVQCNGLDFCIKLCFYESIACD